MIPGDGCLPRKPATQVSASRQSAAGAWSRQPMAEWLTPGRLTPWWPSPVTRKSVPEAYFPVSGLPLSIRLMVGRGSPSPPRDESFVSERTARRAVPTQEAGGLAGLLLRRLRLGLGAVQFPYRRTRRARADRGFGAVTGVGRFEGHPDRLSEGAPEATPIAQRLGFSLSVHPQPPAQPPSLRRRAAANQRRANQPTATPITAPTMTASRFM